MHGRRGGPPLRGPQAAAAARRAAGPAPRRRSGLLGVDELVDLIGRDPAAGTDHDQVTKPQLGRRHQLNLVVDHAFHWVVALCCLIVAVAIQIGVNFANDYSDGVRGTDDDRVGPFRLTGNPAS